MSEPKWITRARTYIGLKEGSGEKDNPKVVAIYAKAGHPEVRRDAVPWCAAFVGAVLAECGIKPTGTLWALDYAKWGQKLKGPAVGAIATKRRKPAGGHVFFVVGYDATHVSALGGNQGDAVCIQRIPRALIHSYSWPVGEPLPVPKASAGKVEARAAGLSEA
jgi:uncharacterized protein (TIGR02594 family)